MSGICGVVNFSGLPVTASLLERMVLPAFHRAPDGVSYCITSHVGVACLSHDSTLDRRGACLPVRDAMFPESLFAADARLDNGESFDFSSIAVRVNSDGVASGPAENLVTDAERILGILLIKGETGTSQVLGDFAFAYWDSARSELHLARDAMGMRSLYYRFEEGSVFFATEISQILAVSDSPKSLDEETICRYLIDMQVPLGRTFYKGVCEVRPGEEVIIGRRGRVKKRTFWHPEPKENLGYLDERDYVDYFRDILISATQCRLLNRKPVGVSLSGGMDSGTVASVGGWLKGCKSGIAPLRAYNWAFEDFPENDERYLSSLITSHYSIPTHDILDRETYPLVSDSDIPPHPDDPFTSIYHRYVNSVMASAEADGLGSILFGSRGDLMVGGAVFDVLGMLTEGLYRDVRGEIARLRRGQGLTRMGAVSQHVLRPLGSDLLSAGMRLAGRIPLFGYSVKANRKTVNSLVSGAPEFIRREFLQRVDFSACDALDVASAGYRNHARRERCRHVLSPLAVRVATSFERTAASYRLSYADVWSDRRVAEFVMASPQHLIHRASQPKRVTRSAMKGIIPEEFIRGARKTSPASLYLAALRGPAYDSVLDLLTNSRCADLGFVDEATLRSQFHGFIAGDRSSDEFWPVLSLEIWLRKYWP